MVALTWLKQIVSYMSSYYFIFGRVNPKRLPGTPEPTIIKQRHAMKVGQKPTLSVPISNTG
jgi:hypothetical protein